MSAVEMADSVVELIHQQRHGHVQRLATAGGHGRPFASVVGFAMRMPARSFDADRQPSIGCASRT